MYARGAKLGITMVAANVGVVGIRGLIGMLIISAIIGMSLFAVSELLNIVDWVRKQRRRGKHN